MNKNGRDYLIATVKSIFSKKAQKEKRLIRRRLSLDNIMALDKHLRKMDADRKETSIEDFEAFKQDNGTYKFGFKLQATEDDFTVGLPPLDGSDNIEPEPTKFHCYTLEIQGTESDSMIFSPLRRAVQDITMPVKHIANEFLLRVQSNMGVYGKIYIAKSDSDKVYSQDDDVHEVGVGEDYQVIFVPDGVNWAPKNPIEELYTKKERKTIRDFQKARRKQMPGIVHSAAERPDVRRLRAFKNYT